MLFTYVAKENQNGDNEGAMLKHIFVILTQWEYDNQSVRRLRGAGQRLSYVLRNRAVIETGG